jgi:hypothetical protein
VTMTNEKSVSCILSSVARNLLKVDVTWAKISSLYCVAGGLAVDCVRQVIAIFVTKQNLRTKLENTFNIFKYLSLQPNNSKCTTLLPFAPFSCILFCSSLNIGAQSQGGTHFRVILYLY